MKAVTYKKYGSPDVLTISEVERPINKDDELLIKVKASAVTNSDIFIRGSKLPFPSILFFRLMMGITKPRKKIPGIVFSGVVKEVGSKTSRFNIGDEVYGMTGYSQGVYAQYCTVKEKDSTAGCISIKPKNISHQEATYAVYGGSLAMQFMDKQNINKGDNILIYGASGTSGTFAVQYGKFLGANVTAVCSGKNSGFVKKLGADNTIDYTVIDSIPSDIKYDLILDSVGKQKTSKLKQNLKKYLSATGKYLSIDGEALKLSSIMLDRITKLLEEESVLPVLDKTFQINEITEAHRYVENGHKRGGVAIVI